MLKMTVTSEHMICSFLLLGFPPIVFPFLRDGTGSLSSKGT